MFYRSFFISICKRIVNQVRSVDQIVLWWSVSYQWTVDCIVPCGNINLLQTQLTVWAKALRFHPQLEHKASKTFLAVLLARSQSGRTKKMVVFEFFGTKDSDVNWNGFRIKNACSKKDTGAGTFRLRKLVQRWTFVSIQANLSRDCCYPIVRGLQVLNTHRQFVVVFVFGFVTLRLWVVLSWSQCCE